MKTTEMVICFMVLFVATMAQEPCQIYKPYPSAAERLIDNTITDDQVTIVNDRYLIEGWYGQRTRVLASGTPPETNHCGTQHPIYLTAAPSRDVDTEQDMTACIRQITTACYSTITVRAKYCGNDLFVFYLDNSPVASSGYCLEPNDITGTGTPLFDGVPKVNITIETVERDKINPVTGMNDKHVSKAYRFFCEFIPSEVPLFYRAVWRIQDTLLYRSPVISGNDNDLRYNLSLFEDQIHRSAGFYIYCEIQASTTQEGSLSSSNTTSEPRFIGINVLTPIVRIKEGEIGKIKLQAAAEIGCYGPRVCPYVVTIQIPEAGDCEASLEAESSCGVNIFDNGENAVHTMSLTAGVVNVIGKSARTFEVTLQSDKIYLSHLIWGNYTIYPRIKVIIEHDTTSIESKTCRLYSDPWLLPFGSERISMQVAGTYTLYKDEDNDIEVQVQTVSCTIDNYGFCNCGMVARAGTTIYMINKCNSAYWVIDYVRCGDGIEVLKVSIHENQSYKYKITFPTGVTVDAKLHDGQSGQTRSISSYVDIMVHPSVLDIGRSVGLCGQLKQSANTLLILGEQHSTDFIESWKVKDKRNMFKKNVLDEWPESNSNIVYTCKCIAPERVPGQPLDTTTCGANNKVEVCVKQDRYQAVTKRSCVNNFSRQRRSIPVHDPAHHSLSRHKRQVSWQGSWTEEKASRFCTNLFNQSAMVELCRQQVPGVDIESSFQTCMDDIQLSGTTDFALSSTSIVHTQCLHEVYVNPVLQTQQADKPSVLEEVASLDCPEECSEHGQCINGSCKCENGYIGNACDIPFNLPPSALEVEYNGHCDLRTSQCADVSVFGGTFVDSQTARCRMIPLKMGFNGTVDESEPHTAMPTVESISEIICPLPVREITPSSIPHHQQTYTGYKISVSNNGEHYSEELSMVMYNSECMTCSKNGDDIQCVISDKHCVADYVCYYDSEQYISNQDYSCRVDASGPRWELTTQDTEDNKIYIIIGAVCSVVVLIVAAIIIAVLCRKGCKKSPGSVKTSKSTVSPYAVHYDNTVG